MQKKIVVITGSPRKKGNTMTLTETFIQSVNAKGHVVTRFDAAELNVRGCRACDACYQTGKACVFDDDFNQIASAIEDADVVIFAAPVYWYTFPAQIKAVIDKMYSIQAKRDLKGIESGLISCCAEDDKATFEGICFAYRRTIELMQWNNIGEVLVPKVLEQGDIKKTDGIARVNAFAEGI